VSGASFVRENPAAADERPARVAVLLPLALAGAYDYAVPAGLALAPGDYVIAPLGKRESIGVVWGAARGDVAPERLKAVAHRFDAPPMPEAQRRFVDWVADYTMSAPGAVLRMALSVPEALAPPAPLLALRARTGFVAAKPLTAARQRALDVLLAHGPMPPVDLARAAGVGAAVVKALAEIGAAEPLALAVAEAAPGEAPDPEAARVALSPQQQDAAEALRAAVRAGAYAATLLEGVTGSGKTEVYFETVAEALRGGRQALVLVPEIALTAQWVERFARRFGAAPGLWHSDLRGSERRRLWRGVAEGRVKVVVGARSALFLPCRNLGLIVVDEEHDSSFKQEDGVVYHARDMAVVRAHLGGFAVVLASATPALETIANVERGRYRRVELPERHGGARLPDVCLVDLRRAPPPPRRWLAPPLQRAVADALAAGEQAMLFLNRRGYAPVTVCRVCGTKRECPNCSAWLVEHRLAGKLQCHHCGYAAAMPKACPACGAEGALVGCGPGVERVAEEAMALFPQARLAVMASDTVHGPEAAQEFVRRMRAGEIDLVVGTQIVAKGHDFPLLTLVGVVDADLSLGGGDLRAGERTWQLLAQVAGRAGRAERPGRVLMQTYMPEHPVLRALAAGDRARFLAAEMEARRTAGHPPHGKLAALVVSAPKREQAERAARDLARAWPAGDAPAGAVEMWGPAPAPLALLRGLYRFRLLVKARRDVALQPLLRRWLASTRPPGQVRIKVDIDPYSFL
jgi:primosomal protein N' (replication factor Y)